MCSIYGAPCDEGEAGADTCYLRLREGLSRLSSMPAILLQMVQSPRQCPQAPQVDGQTLPGGHSRGLLYGLAGAMRRTMRCGVCESNWVEFGDS